MGRFNLLFLMVDELRFPPHFETSELKAWREENCPAMTFLEKFGVTFLQHRVGSTACAPSRATIATGHYPSLHGVTQTSKESNDPRMFWLDPSTVPTWGVYLKEAGYSVYYKGKWHISNADIIIPGTLEPVPSYSELGIPDRKIEEVYLAGDRLSKFGFSGWIGPEPHGTGPHNSGSSAAEGITGRDSIYASEVVELLKEVKGPWAIMASFINPHDETLFGELTRNNPNYNFEIDPTLPEIDPSPTAGEDLSTKPQVQTTYKDAYGKIFQPTIDDSDYRKLYYSLQKRIDSEISRVLDAVDFEKTIVIFTSDHGDYLGSHGLFQKWCSAYEEAIHVPFTVYNPSFSPGTRDILTSHVDIFPTILGLLGLNEEVIRNRIASRYTNCRQLVGRDLSPTIRSGEYLPDIPQYFMTEDHIAETYFVVNIETVIVRIGKDLYKYSRYFDNKRQDEYEMYNLSTDPNEERNLHIFSTPETLIIEEELEKVLHLERQTKRLSPKEK